MSCTSPESAGLDPDVLRDELIELWTRKDVQMLRLASLQGFSKLSEPLEGVLTILEGCPGKQKGYGQTIGHHILMEFQIWWKQHPQVTLSSLSEQQALVLQQRALTILTDIQHNFADSFITIYQLRSVDPAILRQCIVRLQASKCYKEAVVLSVKLQLQNELNMEQICVPVILQNKLSLAESFVTGHRHLEKHLVTMLDSWCHPSFTVEKISKQFPQFLVPQHCMNLFQPKNLTKQVFRLMDKFNIDQGLCPNALRKRRLDSLRYLMYSGFVEKSMTEENWCDHVQYVVADDPELQVELVRLLVKFCGLQKASQWSLRYQIPRDQLPFGVWEMQQSLPPHLQQVHLSDPAQTEEWTPPPSHCEKFYQVPLSQDRVHFVDSPEALQQCRNIVLKEGGVVGLDMEWQPTFGCASAQQIALIQLAVLDDVFLLDLCAEGFCQHPDTVSFIRSLFSVRNVLKLGYGMSGDLKCVLATWHQFLEEPLLTEGMLDLVNVHQKIQCCKAQNGPKNIVVGEDSSEKGLSLLVQQVLGKPLDKTEQMSNWKKRPLRVTQIRYAVADAYCLLDMFSVLSSNPSNFGLPSDLRSLASFHSEKNREKKQKEQRAEKMTQAHGKEECQGAQRVTHPCIDKEKGLLCGEKPSEDTPPLRPQQLRVVCDNMVQGLGRYLRCLGVDVVILENGDDHRVAAKLAQSQGRVILTSGYPFHSLRSQVGEGRCLALDCSEKPRDQAIRVLKHFNVQATLSDIFSRCQACNNNKYVAVPRKEMARLLHQKGLLQEEDNSDHKQQQDVEVTPVVTCDLPRYADQCQWGHLSDLDPDTLTFPGGAPLQLHGVPPRLLPKISNFYVCTKCGKVFWEGSHFNVIVPMFQEVLHITDTE